MKNKRGKHKGIEAIVKTQLNIIEAIFLKAI